jgi:hypothetical protein
MPEGTAYALRGDSITLCWVHHVNEYSTQLFQGVEVTMPGLPDGQYTVRFYDPWTGNWSDDPVRADSRDGILNFTCPDFTSDLAMKITHSDSLGVYAKGYYSREGISIYPNPSQGLLHISFPDQTSVIRLLTVTGQVVKEYHPHSTGRLSLDLSGYQKGIYLLEVSDPAGSRSSSRVVLL